MENRETAMPETRTYIHPAGRVEIIDSKTEWDISVTGSLEMRKDPDGGNALLLRNTAFPDQIGTGTTWDEALASLSDLLEAYIVTFLEKNGLVAFEDRLVENGFDRAAGLDLGVWMPPLKFEVAYRPTT